MVTFDAAVDGTPAREWTTDRRFGASATLDIVELQRAGLHRLVVVAPHPDDETLGAGGLIAECASIGIEVSVIVVTDGSASDPGLQGLASTRRSEVLRAVSILSPDAAVSFLDIPDGQVREERTRVVAALSTELAGFGPDTLLVVPWSGDGHRDHRVVGEVCTDLARECGMRVLEYPIWMWHWGTGDDGGIPWERFARLELAAANRERKAMAIAQFGSQLGTVLRESFVEHFSGATEVFLLTGNPPADEPRLAAAYFDDLYERHDDPWSFASRWYEKRKRAITIAALPGQRYRSALELGCSIGTLTELLAERCDAVLAVDISDTAVALARNRLAGASNVVLHTADVAVDFPAGEFDLVVMSEVGYYFDPVTLDRVLVEVLAHLGEGGAFVACHWLHAVADYPLSGDIVHSKIATLRGLGRILVHREEDFLLEVYSRDTRSVADREGLVS